MMARYRVHVAATFLIRTFCPANAFEPRLLRSWTSRRERSAERVTIRFDLPNADARSLAQGRVGQAPSARLVRVGGKAIHEIQAAVEGDVLTVSALLARA